MQSTTDELTLNLASGEGKFPRIHLSWSEDGNMDSQAQKKVGDSLSQIFDSAWGKLI